MKKLKLTKLIASTLIVALVLALNPIGANAEWRQDDNLSTSSYEYTGDSSSQQSIGFDEISLSSDTLFKVKNYYNKSSRTVDGINTLSIAGQDYTTVYTKGNILGRAFEYENDGDNLVDDYCFDLNNKYTRFTATIGMDDYNYDDNNYSTIERGILAHEEITQRTGTIIIIGDGNVLETKNFKFGEAPVNVDVNINGCSKLIIRVKINSAYICSSILSYYDILNGQFYLK